ncbi:MAG: hypothetical protein AABM32_03240 [Chloroflexota bacterium]
MSAAKLRGTLIGLELFTAVGAIAGAIFVVPGLPREWLAGSPFSDYTVPALALGILCGGSSMAAAVLVVWRPALGGITSVAAGAAMAIFEVVEVAAVGFMIVEFPAEPASYLQPFYFLVGLAMAGLGVVVWRDAHQYERTRVLRPAHGAI